MSDIWVGWSDSVVCRNTAQPERLPLCPSRLCRTKILTPFWHDCCLKLNLQLTGFPGFTSFSFQYIYLFCLFFNRNFCSRHAARDPSWQSGCIHQHLVHFKPRNSQMVKRQSFCKRHYSNKCSVPADRTCPLGGESRREGRLVGSSFPKGQLLTLLEI